MGHSVRQQQQDYIKRDLCEVDDDTEEESKEAGEGCEGGLAAGTAARDSVDGSSEQGRRALSKRKRKDDAPSPGPIKDFPGEDEGLSPPRKKGGAPYKLATPEQDKALLAIVREYRQSDAFAKQREGGTEKPSYPWSELKERSPLLAGHIPRTVKNWGDKLKNKYPEFNGWE
ncbi:hypothetical protein HDV00_009819 [Rhizophlyctis rosea]|nr:hypothetical protein HDV00_009819 [Rhizophlyctis rosea]